MKKIRNVLTLCVICLVFFNLENTEADVRLTVNTWSSYQVFSRVDATVDIYSKSCLKLMGTGGIYKAWIIPSCTYNVIFDSTWCMGCPFSYVGKDQQLKNVACSDSRSSGQCKSKASCSKGIRAADGKYEVVVHYFIPKKAAK